MFGFGKDKKRIRVASHEADAPGSSPFAWRMKFDSNHAVGSIMSRLLQVGRFLVAVAILLSFPAGSAQAALEDHDATHLVKILEQKDSEYLVDMHGNAHGALRQLEVLRFKGTAAVQAGIDRMESDSQRAAQVRALYGVLGFVKDPASIPWLEKKLRSTRRQSVYDGRQISRRSCPE